MANSTLWWLLAAGAVVLELLSGTIYLLMIAIGFAGAALAAHLGASAVTQTVVAAVVGVGAVLGWHFSRRRLPVTPAQANRDVNLDIGEQVFVDAWNADGTATVRYRGAQWTVVPRPGATPSTGVHRVVEVIGNRLVVDKP